MTRIEKGPVFSFTGPKNHPLSPPPSEPSHQRASFKNWLGNVEARPQAFLLPQSEEELASAIRAATKVRFLGAGHSFNRCMVSADTMIDMSAFNEIRAPEAAESKMGTGAHTITVGGGAKLEDVVTTLERKGLALETLPTSGDITIAGAIANGVHGSGLRYGALSDQVEALELMNGQGKLVRLEGREARDAAVHLGSLGALVRVTLRAEPLYHIEKVRETRDEGKVLAELDAKLQKHDRILMLWHPTARLITSEYDDNVPAIVPAEPKSESLADRLSIPVYTSVLHAASKLNFLIPLSNWLFRAAMSDEHVIRTPKDALLNDPEIKVQDLSYLVPLEPGKEASSLTTALEAIRRAFREQDYCPHLPVAIRFVRGSDTALSPTRGETCAAIEVFSHVAFNDHEAVFRDVEEKMRDLGGAPHWGKTFYQNPRRLYSSERLERFEAIRQRLDPGEKFSNRWTKSIIHP
ncbi:MAG: D-arabinono-1,4-lactone oxidase [Myxococcota bacterium]